MDPLLRALAVALAVLLAAAAPVPAGPPPRAAEGSTPRKEPADKEPADEPADKGPESAEYAFTSSLPAQVLRELAPLLEPMLGAPPGDDATSTFARR